MGFEGNPAAEAQEVVDRLADEILGIPAEPVGQAAIELDDAAVGESET